MTYLQKVFLLISLICPSISPDTPFPYDKINYKEICDDKILKESKSYGEFTVFFDFFKKFTSKDETDLELL